MHRLIILLALCAAPALAVDLIVTPQHPKLNVHMQDACLLGGFDCTGLEAPTLIFDETAPVIGYYPLGTRTVFVSSQCLTSVADVTKCEAVLVHELVHYILYMQGHRDRCDSEAQAWDVYNAYVMERKRLDLVRENWQESYPQCAKSPAASTS